MKIVHKPQMEDVHPVSDVHAGTLVTQAQAPYKLGVVVRSLSDDNVTHYFAYLATGLIVKDPEYKVIPVPDNHNVVVCND